MKKHDIAQAEKQAVRYRKAFGLGVYKHCFLCGAYTHRYSLEIINEENNTIQEELVCENCVESYA